MDTEQRIALARGYFNEIATHYNTRLETVLERYLAALGGMKPQPLMAANDFERAPVKVELTATAAGPVTSGSPEWRYTTQTALTVGQHVSIEAAATDRPGNTTSRTETKN